MLKILSRPSFQIHCLLFSFLVASPGVSRAQVDPSIDWKTMHLPHFDLIYDAHHQELANIYAARLEGAYANVSPLFPPGPSRTAVVLDDRTDLTNGSATVFPYPVIVSYPVLPAPQESIGEYNDWASELVTHELTHVKAMNPQRGTVQSLSSVFGSIMSPNILLPRWWHEGLAVEMETRFSTAGRLRSPQQDAWLRSYIVDDRWNSMKISEANEVTIPTWPYGARPYLIGAVLWSELLEMKGPQIANDLAWAHGGRAPYIINQPAMDLIGMYYYDFFKLMHDRLEQRLQKQISQLKAIPITKSENIGLKDYDVNSPTLSPDGLSLAVSGKDHDSGRRWVAAIHRNDLQSPFDATQITDFLNANPNDSFLEMKSPLPREQTQNLHSGIDETESDEQTKYVSRVSWMPDSKSVVYDSVDILDWFHETSDLYLYTFETKKTQRLSWGLRAREPVVSPNGKTITYVKVLPGKTEIASFDIDQKKETEILISVPLQARCSHPTYLDENTLIFSYRENGRESLEALDLLTKKVRVILPQFSNANFPEVVNKKLIFTSSVNGVHNLYASNENLAEAKPVTHNLTAVYQSTWDWSRNDYYLTEQTSRGLQVTRVEANAQNTLPTELPHVDPLFADRYPASKPELITMDNSDAVTKAPIDDYSALDYSLPKYWMPWFSWDTFSSYLSASTSNSDPLGKHQYSASGIYDIGYNRLSYSATYVNQQTPAQLLATLNDITYNLPGGILDRNVFDHVEANWELTPISPRFQAGVGYTKMSFIEGTASSIQSGPTLQAAYSNFAQTGAQISPESGWGARIAYTAYQPAAGQYNYNQLQFSLLKYFSSFLPKRHAIMAKFQSYYMDQFIPSNFAVTYSQAIYANTALPQFLMRGFPSATFQGRVLNNLTAEYRFPLRRLYKGWDTSAMFLKQMHAAFVVDGVNLDGYAYNTNLQAYQTAGLSQTFWSVGAEGRIDTTVGYQFPVTFYVGIYTPTNNSLTSGGNYALGLYF